MAAITPLLGPSLVFDGSQPIKAVIFDMDGLLLDTETLSFDSFVATAQRYDLQVDISHYRQMIGMNAASSIDILRRLLPAGLDAVVFKDEWLVVYRELLVAGVDVKAGAFDLLHHLQATGIRRAVATSSAGHKARTILADVGLLPLFDHVTGGDEVKAGKPAPDVYLDAARKLGIAPADCLALEDSENGVTAALAAGMTVIQIPDLAPAARPAAPPHFHLATCLAEVTAKMTPGRR